MDPQFRFFSGTFSARVLRPFIYVLLLLIFNFLIISINILFNFKMYKNNPITRDDIKLICRICLINHESMTIISSLTSPNYLDILTECFPVHVSHILIKKCKQNLNSTFFRIRILILFHIKYAIIVY